MVIRGKGPYHVTAKKKNVSRKSEICLVTPLNEKKKKRKQKC